MFKRNIHFGSEQPRPSVEALNALVVAREHREAAAYVQRKAENLSRQLTPLVDQIVQQLMMRTG